MNTLITRFLASLFFVFISIPVTHAEQIQPAGYSIEIENYVAARESQQWKRKLIRQSPVYTRDIVESGNNAKAVLTFWDGASLSMSENSEIVLADFVYDPEESTSDKLVIDIGKGIFRVITGAVVSKEEDRFQLKTSFGPLGVRGTDLLVTSENGTLVMAVLSGGPALFTSAITGAVTAIDHGMALTVSQSVPSGKLTPITQAMEQQAESLSFSSRQLRQTVANLLGRSMGSLRGSNQEILLQARQHIQKLADQNQFSRTQLEATMEEAKDSKTDDSNRGEHNEHDEPSSSCSESQ